MQKQAETLRHLAQQKRNDELDYQTTIKINSANADTISAQQICNDDIDYQTTIKINNAHTTIRNAHQTLSSYSSTVHHGEDVPIDSQSQTSASATQIMPNKSSSNGHDHTSYSHLDTEERKSSYSGEEETGNYFNVKTPPVKKLTIV